MTPRQHIASGPLAHLAQPDNLEFLRVEAQVTTSRAFYNLMFKRQVHRPFNIYYTKIPALMPLTRFEHTSIVSQTAYNLAFELGLNFTLTSAGAHAHDVGHVGKGHFGEQWIRQHTGKSFFHECFGLILLEEIYQISLPHEVAQCIALHSWSSKVMERPDVTEECRVVALADKFAYTIADALETRHLLWVGGYEQLRYSWPERKRLIAELDGLLADLYPPYRPFLYYPQNRQMGYLPYSTSKRWKRENRKVQTEVTALMFEILHHLEAKVVEESTAVGKVQFREEPTFSRFIALKNWLSKKMYAVADFEEQESRELEGALRYLTEYFPEHNPLHLLILLNDLLLRRAAILVGAAPTLPEYSTDDLWEIWHDIQEDTFHALEILRDKPDLDIFARPDWITPPS